MTQRRACQAHRQATRREEHLHDRLVHADCRRQHAGADIGTLASSSRPCTVPSSPYGPCSTGNTTSSASPVTARPRPSSVLSIDRDQRVAARMRGHERLARRRRSACRLTRAARSRRPRKSRRRPVGQQPPSVLLDLDRRPARSVRRSRNLKTDAAEASDTSCSPERPP